MLRHLVPPVISRGAPRHATWETPISEGRNYGREMAGQFGLWSQLPRKSQGSLTCRLYFSEGRHTTRPPKPLSQRYCGDFSSSEMWHCDAGRMDLRIAAVKLEKTVTSANKALRTHRAGSHQTYGILKLFVSFLYRIVFCSADRRQYFGSMLRGLGVTALIIMWQGEYRVTRKPPTGYLYQQMCVCTSPKLKDPAPVLRPFYTILFRCLLENFWSTAYVAPSYFGLNAFEPLHSITVTNYFWWEYRFYLRPFFKGKHIGRKTISQRNTWNLL
jgi:hypothetical protein